MRTTFIDQIPVRIGRPEEFALVAQALKEASFHEDTICRAFNLANMSKIGSIDESQVERCELSPRLRVLVRLFLVLSLVPRTEAEQAFDKPTVDAFISLGLIGTGEFGSDEYYAQVLVYPVADFLIVSDRHSLPDESEFEPPPDVVFPAIFGGTLEFLKLLPSHWNGTALDLCSGSGIGALSLARSGRSAVAADITERAMVFAQFNCALNQINNVEVKSGDLYEAIDKRTFGCIVAHPPYVPSLQTTKIWRDGGTTGDTLVKRMVQELPRHLDRGGLFFCICLGADTQEEKFEERIRAWLGSNANEFDIIFATKEVRSPNEVLENLARRNAELLPDQLEVVRSEYERAGVLRMTLGALYLRRTVDDERKPWTARKHLGSETRGTDFEQAFAIHDRVSDPAFLQRLEQSAPSLAPRLEVKVTHVVHHGSLVPAEVLFEVDQPFEARATFEMWMIPLLSRFDGKTTVANIYSEAKGTVPESFKLQSFAELVARTLELGFTVLN
jgi:methylase of polypeptide subunit release factors